MPEMVRLELWDSRTGKWVTAHAGIALLHPEKYAARLLANGKTARALELDDKLQPTGVVWGSPTPHHCDTCADTVCDEADPPGFCLLF